MKVKRPFLLVKSILICQGAGIIGSLFTAPAVRNWYQTINKPSFNPPNWVFAPVWTTLFILMGIALYLVWRESSQDKKVTRIRLIFFVHLGLNILWSVLFFGRQNPGLAFLEILVLLGFIIYLVKAFGRINKTAGWLLVPYLAWVSFASILNYSIWRLN